MQSHKKLKKVTRNDNPVCPYLKWIHQHQQLFSKCGLLNSLQMDVKVCRYVPTQINCSGYELVIAKIPACTGSVIPGWESLASTSGIMEYY